MAVGLGGRDRPAASAAERARLTVTKRIKDAVARVGRQHSSLGEHLARCATGYRICLPFLSPSLVAAERAALPLYRRIVPPDLPGLSFIGLVDAPAGLLPIVERQSAWLAEVLTGRLRLPSRAAMLAAIDAAEPRTRERFPLEPLHSIRCDPHAYVRLLDGDRRRAVRPRDRMAPARPAVAATAARVPAP